MSVLQTAISNYVETEFLRGEGKVQSEQPLIKDGIIDSLGIFLIIAFLQKEFQVKVRPEDVTIDNFQTVSAIEQLVVALGGKSEAA